MTDKQQRARELLAVEFRRDGLDQVADSILSGHAIPNDARSLRAIAAALPDEQPAQGPACVACDDKPAPENNPCAVCGRLLAPPAGPAVEELLADLRERAAKVPEQSGNRLDGGRSAAGKRIAMVDLHTIAVLKRQAESIRALPLTTEGQNA